MKQRLIGAVVLVLAAVVFVPMLLDQGGEEPPPRESGIAPQPSADTPARVAPLEVEATAPERAPSAPAKSAARPPAKASVKKSTKSSVQSSNQSSNQSSTQSSSRSPTGAPTGTGTFAVQLGSFSKAANARGLRDKLLASGYTAFIETSGSVTRVYVGPQSSRAEAEKTLKKLLADTKLKGIVVNFSG